MPRHQVGDLLKTACGTPLYIAPEVLLGTGYDGRLSDVWSLGVILYIMVAGMLLWSELQVPELLEQILHGEYRIPFYLSVSLQSLLAQMMNIDPAQRPTLKDIANHPWVRGWTAERQSTTGSMSRTCLRLSLRFNQGSAAKLACPKALQSSTFVGNRTGQDQERRMRVLMKRTPSKFHTTRPPVTAIAGDLPVL